MKVYSQYTVADPIVTYDTSARQILIRKAFQFNLVGDSSNDQIVIQLFGFINPTTNTASSSFIVKTFNEVDVSSTTYLYYID